MQVVTEIWRRATVIQAPPRPEMIAAIAALGLVLVLYRHCWPLTRLLVTITHEGAHALTALLVGRRLSGIRLNSDTSGVTLSRGRPRGPGMIVMLTMGYLGPPLAGLGAAGMLTAGYSIGLLWLFVAVVSLMLLMIRNAYGILVLVVAGGATVLISWYLPATWQSAVAYLITWVLLIAAPKPVLELMIQRRRGADRGSDVDQLARLTRMPGGLWAAAFLLVCLAGLVLGTALLLPGLTALFRPLFSG